MLVCKKKWVSKMHLECGLRVKPGAPGLRGMTVKEMRSLLSSVNINISGNRETLSLKIKQAIQDQLLDTDGQIIKISTIMHTPSPVRSLTPTTCSPPLLQMKQSPLQSFPSISPIKDNLILQIKQSPTQSICSISPIKNDLPLESIPSSC